MSHEYEGSYNWTGIRKALRGRKVDTKVKEALLGLTTPHSTGFGSMVGKHQEIVNTVARGTIYTILWNDVATAHLGETLVKGSLRQ